MKQMQNQRFERGAAELIQKLRAVPCANRIERAQRRMLERLIESSFTIQTAGEEIDEECGAIAYVIDKRAILNEFPLGLLSCVLVREMIGSVAIFRDYVTKQSEQIGVFREDEKELALKNIEKILGV